MISASVKSGTPQALATIKVAGTAAIKRVVVEYFTLLLRALGVSNPRPYLTPSAPGEIPRLRTGFLRSNVAYEFAADGLSARVGVRENAKYGLYLELGTRRTAARPWLLRVLKDNTARLRELAAG